MSKEGMKVPDSISWERNPSIGQERGGVPTFVEIPRERPEFNDIHSTYPTHPDDKCE